MALRPLRHALGIFPMPTPHGSEELTVRFQYDSAVDGNLALNDVIEAALLPADCVPVDWALDVDDLDGVGPTIVLDFGILNAAKTAVSAAIATAISKVLRITDGCA